MSFFGKLFGGGKSDGKPPTPGEAIQRLREVEEMLTKKQEYLESKCDEQLAIAKKYGTKNKRVALKALKAKKRIEKQLEQIDGTLTTIEFQRESLENANTNTEVLKIMGLAAKALKNAHKMDVDEVHELMDDVQEQQELAREITDVISNPVGYGQEFDEDELTKELEELEQEELDRQLVEINPAGTELPSVPTAEPSRPARAKPVEEEDPDFRELAAWAS